MVKLIKRAINGIENKPINFKIWVISFLAIIIFRILIENWLGDFKNRPGIFIFYEFSHTFLFFLIAYLLFLGIIKKFTGESFGKISNVLLWGYLIILTPPIFDHIISKGEGFWSFYEFDGLAGLFQRFLTFFGSTPEIGITYGVRIEVALVIILIFLYTFIKNYKSKLEIQSTNFETNPKFKLSNIKTFEFRSLFRISNFDIRIYFIPLIVAILSYLVLFILGTFPSYVTILAKGLEKGFFRVSEIDVAQMFLSPTSIFFREILDIPSSLNVKMSLIYSLILSIILFFGLCFYFKEKLFAFIRNSRPPQLIYHGGLFFVGIGLGFLLQKGGNLEALIISQLTFFNIISIIILLESIGFSWLASVVPNDLEDKKIDEKTNSWRPLPRNVFSESEYKTIGVILFLSAIFFSAIVSFKIALLLVAYQAMAWIYSSFPLRLKRFALVSTFLSALASSLILFSGFILVHPSQDISSLPWQIIALLIFAFTFSLPLKDFKDIEGDKSDGVYTVPVFFGESWGKIITGGGIFLSFVLSVLVFNEPGLFWWAIVFGSISFFLVNNMSAHDVKKNLTPYFWCKIHYRNIIWWILGTVTIYGIILIKTIIQ